MEPESPLLHLQVPATGSYPESYQFSPCPHSTSGSSILILCFHLAWGFPHKTLYTTRLSPSVLHGHSHSSRCDHPNNIWWVVHFIKVLIMSFSPLPYYLVLFKPKYSPQHPILKHLQPMFLNVSDQVSHPYKTTGKIIFPFILIFIVLNSNLEDNRFCIEWWQAFPDLSLLLICSWSEFWFVKVVHKYLNCSTLSKELLSIFILLRLPACWSRDITTF